MAWIQANLMTILGLWMVANVVLSAIATQVPPTSAVGKALHVLVAVGPLDVVKALKTLGTAAVPPLGMLLVFACATIGASHAGCTPAARAPIERTISAALTDTQLVCLFAKHLPGPADVHADIVLGCGIVDGTEAALGLLAASDAVALASGNVSAAQGVVRALAGDAGP